MYFFKQVTNDEGTKKAKSELVTSKEGEDEEQELELVRRPPRRGGSALLTPKRASSRLASKQSHIPSRESTPELPRTPTSAASTRKGRTQKKIMSGEKTHAMVTRHTPSKK
jgi:hypothetical protein